MNNCIKIYEILLNPGKKKHMLYSVPKVNIQWRLYVLKSH